MLEEIREERVTTAILDGYRRMPPHEADDLWADAATRTMISEEPWPWGPIAAKRDSLRMADVSAALAAAAACRRTGIRV